MRSRSSRWNSISPSEVSPPMSGSAVFVRPWDMRAKESDMNVSKTPCGALRWIVEGRKPVKKGLSHGVHAPIN